MKVVFKITVARMNGEEIATKEAEGTLDLYNLNRINLTAAFRTSNVPANGRIQCWLLGRLMKEQYYTFKDKIDGGNCYIMWPIEIENTGPVLTEDILTI